MRIQLITVGTMGSVAPYTGLGHRLADEGHEVEIVTHAKFAEVVGCCGLRMRPLAADPFEALIGAHSRLQGAQGSPDAPGALRALWSLRSATGLATLGLVDGILDAVDPTADLILLSTLAAPIGAQVAEYHRIPSIGVFLQPEVPTREFAPCATAWRPPGRANLLRGRAANVLLDSFYGAARRRLHTRLGLTHRSGHRLRSARERNRWPIWHGYSPSVVPRPADWRPGLHVAGYWWPHECPNWQPPALVADFLTAGPPPVLIGFGSMMPGDPRRLGEIAARALRQAGLRGIVQSGSVGLSVVDDDVITVGALPHGWLMPRTAAVVHHAGAGTTAAALRAGVPAVPVPVMTDQPWWAARLVQLGVSPQVLPCTELTAGRLAEALGRATGDAGFARRSGALAARLADEDGSGAVARAVAELAG
ncbi:glycosyltransferase [Saccharothrix sp. ST-888]|uniref:glycosyltransferase n=1 Tax=Saccharothrix sp. ST-888 TaxID=1427391 RepID=UPI0005ECF7B6|nr:nucleotide disphospho-sugar-binding domain-containing protein [Saccharothrix sp. ST-888]KJK59344.1 glycosyl transferase [Saccharothrix sp. ST-888]